MRAARERAEYEKTLPPKKPQGAYIIFANEVRPQVRARIEKYVCVRVLLVCEEPHVYSV